MNLRLKLFALTALICGVFVASAVEPVAVWSGDFNETTKGNYTLSANGNTVAADGSSITISTTATKGVLVDISPASTTGKTTLIVKYSGLSTPSSNAVLLSGAMNSQIKDLVGVAVKSDGSISNIWDNNVDSRGSVDSSVVVPQTGIVAFTYDGNNSTASNKGGAFYVKTASGMARKAQSLGSLFSTGNPVNGFAIGGKRASGSLGVIPGLVIEGVAIFDSVLSTTDMAAYEFPAPPKKVEPLMLLNINNGTAVDGWLNHTQDGGPIIPNSGSLTTNGISFVTSSEGNFYKQRASGTSFQSGEFIGLDGKTYDSIASEVSSSLGLPTGVVFDDTVYNTGVMNGGKVNHTATLSGLDNSTKYLLYLGCGRDHADADYQSGFKFETSGCASVDELAYANTDSTSYQTGSLNNDMLSTTDGLLIVRAKGIKPVNGTIQFKMVGGRSSLNFLAVAKVNETVTYTTAKIDGGSEIAVTAINEALTETNDKAEVTLTAGATVYVDETPAVPTKLICEGSITLSANAKPDLTKLDLSGVTGGIVRTWLTDAEKKGVGFNFASKRGPVTSAALVADTAWYDNNDGGSNDEGKNGTNVAMSSDGLTTITWTSANTYDDDASTHGNNSSASMVRGYLDDGNSVSITVKNVPFAEYAVIIYASTDDPNNPYLTHKVVNDENYTYDSTCSDVAKVGTDAWGQGRSSSTVAYGTNAIRVIEQKKGTLTITSPKDTSIKARGCVSAIQIVPYSSFVAPTVTIASVETKCSEDYASNMITGMIADYVANSWEGDLSARVVVDSKVYESAAIEDNKFTIEVSDLKQATVYRTVLEVGYTDGETFNAIATKAIALYQGERKFVWIASPFKIQDATLVNEAQGLTISNPFEDPDYIDLCDSEFTVSISASEAVDAENDAALDGTEQGGVRIAQTSNGLKLQVVDKGAWVDFADAAVETTYTLTVKFHYKKSQEDETDATSVTYTLDSTTKTSTNTTGKQKVTEIFVSDGTNLAKDLFGACQLDSAVIVDIELKPGEGDAIDYNTEAEANAAIKTLKIGICDAVKGILTTETQQATYRSYFHLVVVPSKMLENGFSVKTEFTTEAKSEIEKELETALSEVVNAFNSGSAKIVGKPGLYYGVKRGETLEAMSVKEDLQMADADGKVTITITKPDTSKSHFYRIIVSPTPAETK